MNHRIHGHMPIPELFHVSQKMSGFMYNKMPDTHTP